MLQRDKTPIICRTCPLPAINANFFIVKLYKLASTLTIPTVLRYFAMRQFEIADGTRQFMDNGSKAMDNMMFVRICHREVTRQRADSEIFSIHLSFLLDLMQIQF